MLTSKGKKGAAEFDVSETVLMYSRPVGTAVARGQHLTRSSPLAGATDDAKPRGLEQSGPVVPMLPKALATRPSRRVQHSITILESI